MVIFTNASPFFGAPYLAEALDVDLFVQNINYNDFFGKKNVKGKFCGNKTEKIVDKDILIIGATALKKISNRIVNGDFNNIILILCDTAACLDYKWWNDFVVKHNIRLYIMPDIKEFCSVDYKPIYQYIKLDENLKQKKQNKLLITHSPRNQIKQDKKGSNLIVSIINKLKKKHDFDFKQVTGLSMTEAISEKSKSHIFIDQLIYKNNGIKQKNFGGKIVYNGGLGKSGIEAMLLNCVVITGGVNPKTEQFFDTPPITWSSADSFYDDLEKLITDEELRNQQISNQNSWLDKYMNQEFYKKYLNND